MRVRVRDDLAEMFSRRMSAIHKRAREELEQIQSRRRAQMEKLVELLDGVVDIVAEGEDDAQIGLPPQAIWSLYARAAPRSAPSAATTTPYPLPLLLRRLG